MFDQFQLSGSSFYPHSSAIHECPICKTSYLDCINRRFVDRVISQFVPVKRYNCAICGWNGNFVVQKK